MLTKQCSGALIIGELERSYKFPACGFVGHQQMAILAFKSNEKDIKIKEDLNYP